MPLISNIPVTLTGTVSSPQDIGSSTLMGFYFKTEPASTVVTLNWYPTLTGTKATVIDGLGAYTAPGGNFILTLPATAINTFVPLPAGLMTGFRYVGATFGSAETGLQFDLIVREAQ